MERCPGPTKDSTLRGYGRTLLRCGIGDAIAPALYKRLNHDFMKDFTHIARIGTTPNVLVVHPALPAKNVAQFVALAKAHPGKLNYGMTGVGNSLHLTMEMFKRAAGIDIQAVPYRGDALLNPALIAGEIDVAIVPIGTIVPLIEGGQLRALAVNSARRSTVMPDVPTVSEAAIPGFEAAGWQGYFVPAGTPREIVERIQRETAAAITLPDTQARLKTMGNDPVASTAEEFSVKFRADVAKFQQVVREAGIPLQ